MLLKPPVSCLVTLFGVVMIGIGLYFIDPVLLVHHNVAEGWVSNVYTDPHQLPGGKNQNSYYADVYYAYQDKQGEYYRRKALGVGSGVESGDTFSVLYYPDNPSRHLPLTLWALFKPLCLFVTGLVCGLYGFRQCRDELALRGSELNRRRGRRRREGEIARAQRLSPLISEAAERIVQNTLFVTALAEFGWLDLSSPTNPHQHSLYYVFATDEALANATKEGVTGRIQNETYAQLKQSGYPEGLLGDLSVLFSSSESIDRDFGPAALAKVRRSTS